MVRPTDQEMTAIEKIVYYFTVPKRREPAMPQRATEEAPRSVSRQREREENMGERLYCGFCGKEQARCGK